MGPADRDDGKEIDRHPGLRYLEGGHQPREPAAEVCRHEARKHRVARHAPAFGVGGPQRGADDQEQGELDEHDDTAAHQGDPRVAQRPGCEQALDDQVIGPVRGGRQHRPARDGGEERVGLRQRDAEVEHAQLPGLFRRAKRGRHQLPRDVERRRAGEHVHDPLHHVYPHYCAQPARVRVHHGRGAEHEDRRGVRPPRDDRERDRRREQAHAVAEGARQHEDRGRSAPRAASPARAEHLVGGGDLAREVAGKQQPCDERATDNVAERQLEEGEVAAVADAGDRDDGERAGLGRDD